MTNHRLQFGIKDAIVIGRSTFPYPSPGFYRSDEYKSYKKKIGKQFAKFREASNQWLRNPSLETHNKLWKATNAFENTVRYVNDISQMEPSGSLYQTHRTPGYSLAETMGSFQPRTRHPHQYGSTLGQLGQSLHQTHRTPGYSLANLTPSFTARSRQPYQYGSTLGQLGQSLHQTHRTPT